MEEMKAQLKENMNPSSVSFFVSRSENKVTNEAKLSSTEQRKNQKRSLKEIQDNDVVHTSNGNGDIRNESELIPGAVSPLKKNRIDDSHTGNVDKHEWTTSPDEDDSLVMDICDVVGLQPNTRIEVQWDLIMEESNRLESKTRWWGAKLLPHDGRMHTLSGVDGLGDDPVTVPLRVLDYDPYVGGGFPERSRAEVAFINEHLLYELATETHLSFRTEGSTWEDDEDINVDDETVISSDGWREEELRGMIESLLQYAVIAFGCSGKIETLSAAQQWFMAEKIRASNESLIEKMMKRIKEEDDGVIKADCVRKCMQEMENELLLC